MGVALGFFTLAALGGLYVASRHFKGTPPPLGIGLFHGLLGASGLVSLLLFVMGNAAAPKYSRWALGLFVVTALGGFLLFSFRLRGKPVPRPVIVVHALVAVTAYSLLLRAFLA